MRALLCKSFGPADELIVEEVANPEPGPGEVVIDVHAASVNFPDTLIIENKYQFKPELPFSPGGECAGTIASVGEGVGHLQPGLRVVALTGWGAFAEQVKCSADVVVPLLPDVPFDVAAAFLMTYATSYHALSDRARLKKGETLLVMGASGGVGIAAIEIGKALGATVIAAASTPEKLAICRDHGADEVVNYVEDDFRPALKEITKNKGVDVVYDPVGGHFTELALRSCAWRGRHLVVGFAAGEIPHVPANLLLLKGASLIGVFWGDYARREPMKLLMDLKLLFEWLSAGTIKPYISGRYTLDDAAEAIAALTERRVSGKLVVEPGK